MARRKSTGKRRRPISEIILYALSLLVVLSMAIGFVISDLLPTSGTRQPTSTPTVLASATPTPTGQPTGTLTATAVNPTSGTEATPQPTQ